MPALSCRLSPLRKWRALAKRLRNCTGQLAKGLDTAALKLNPHPLPSEGRGDRMSDANNFKETDGIFLAVIKWARYNGSAQ